MNAIPGTEGYGDHLSKFIAGSQALDFCETNRDFIPYLPAAPSKVLDAGCGAGQNAAALAGLGHAVTAVDPMQPFLEAAKSRYRDLGITWGDDSLPHLRSLGADRFDFVLIDGVWHHLSKVQRQRALERVVELLLPGGRCAISLRNGPPGMGSRVYPTDAIETRTRAEELGLECVFFVEHQASILVNKEAVEWSRIVLERGVDES